MKNYSTVKDRILAHIDSLGISKRSFYDKTGIANGTLDKPGGVTEQLLERYLSAYPEINPTWLLTGEGTMRRGEVEYEKEGEVGKGKVHLLNKNVQLELREDQAEYQNKSKELTGEVTLDENTGEMTIRLPGLVKRISKLEGKIGDLMIELSKLKGEKPG